MQGQQPRNGHREPAAAGLELVAGRVRPWPAVAPALSSFLPLPLCPRLRAFRAACSRAACTQLPGRPAVASRASRPESPASWILDPEQCPGWNIGRKRIDGTWRCAIARGVARATGVTLGRYMREKTAQQSLTPLREFRTNAEPVLKNRSNTLL